MANWKGKGKFLLFKETNEVKQISHMDNGIIWFTDNTFLYPMDFHTVKPITLNLKYMLKPIIEEVFADNGEHSHWKLIDSSTGKTLWEQSEQEQSSPQNIDDSCIEFGMFLYAENCDVDVSNVDRNQVALDYKRYLTGRK